MKDTGKTINGVKVYEDPQCPPGQLFMLSGNFVNQPPRRAGQLTEITKTTWKEYIRFFWFPVILAIILFVFLWIHN